MYLHLNLINQKKIKNLKSQSLKKRILLYYKQRRDISIESCIYFQNKLEDIENKKLYGLSGKIFSSSSISYNYLKNWNFLLDYFFNFFIIIY